MGDKLQTLLPPVRFPWDAAAPVSVRPSAGGGLPAAAGRLEKPRQRPYGPQMGHIYCLARSKKFAGPVPEALMFSGLKSELPWLQSD